MLLMLLFRFLRRLSDESIECREELGMQAKVFKTKRLGFEMWTVRVGPKLLGEFWSEAAALYRVKRLNQFGSFQ